MGQPRSQGSLLPVPTERESTGRREPENSPFIIGTFEKLAPGLELGTGGKLVLSKYPHINVRLNFSRLSRIFCELTQVVNFTLTIGLFSFLNENFISRDLGGIPSTIQERVL